MKKIEIMKSEMSREMRGYAMEGVMSMENLMRVKRVMKEHGMLMLSGVLTLLAVLTGVDMNALMGVTTLDGGGITNSGNGSDSVDAEGNELRADYGGIATETQGRADMSDESIDNAEYYQKDIDRKIVKIRPMSTPIDTISRYAKERHTDSFEVKYYSVGTRPISTTLLTDVTAQTAGTSMVLVVSDPSIFTIDDTIRVVDQKAENNYKGDIYKNDVMTTPDLVLCVCGRDDSTGNPVVYALNGNEDNSGGFTYLPAISAGSKLIRMGKACAELDVQTGRFNNIPTANVQYCQNFMIQVEQSTFDKIAKKEVNWTFSDIEEDSIYDMKLAQENTYLFGDKGYVNHTSKNGSAQWFTGGIWWMAGKDLEIGSRDSSGNVTIKDDELVDMSKDLFVGTGIGNKRKVLLCGSEMLAALSKIESDKFRLKDTVEVWNLKFKSWETDFGEILTIHHELFDVNGMSDCGFALDPEYLTKAVHLSWSRNVLDLQKAGVRKTDAVVIQEVAALYLRYPNAHARVKLAAISD